MQKLAFRVAVAAGGCAGLVGVILTFAAAVPIVYPVVSAAAVGIAVYLVLGPRITGRLRRLDAVLDDLRRVGGRRDRMRDQGGDELDRLVRKADQAEHAVRARITDLSRVENYRREYVGDVSHEIKTPIFAIQGFAETLLSGALDDPSVNRGFVEKILHHAARLNALARDLSEISRLETGELKLSRGRFHVGRMFEEVKDSLDLPARRKGIELRTDVGAGAEHADGDRERIRQVMTNLADNAVKYNARGGWVLLGARREGGEVQLFVQDNGIGIAPENVPRVTERFFRVDKSRSRVEGGTGLGLSIVKHILAAHGTALDIGSAPGEGSTFSFSLPALDVPESVHAE